MKGKAAAGHAVEVMSPRAKKAAEWAGTKAEQAGKCARGCAGIQCSERSMEGRTKRCFSKIAKVCSGSRPGQLGGLH